MAQVTITVPSGSVTTTTGHTTFVLNAGSRASLGDALSNVSGADRYFGSLSIPRQLGQTMEMTIYGSQSGDDRAGSDFSDIFENRGGITITASDGMSATLRGPNHADYALRDSSNPYTFRYSVQDSFRETMVSFANHLAGLTDKECTLLFDDSPNEPPHRFTHTFPANLVSVTGSWCFIHQNTQTPHPMLPDGLCLRDDQFLQHLVWHRGTGRVSFHIASGSTVTSVGTTGENVRAQMLEHGFIRCVASNGESVTFTMDATVDDVEPYNWIPTNSSQLLAFATTLAGLSDDSVTVTIDNGANRAPEASASANVNSVDAGGSITLTGSGTDPDLIPDTLSYQWTASPNIGSFADATAASTTWNAPAVPVDNDRPVILTLTATEPDEMLTGSASVNVTVRGNRAPTVTAMATPMTVDSGGVVNLVGTAMDPEGQAMTYTWASDVGGQFSAPTALTGTWTAPTVSEATVATLTLTANDGGRTGSANATVIVRAPTTTPLALPDPADQTSATGDIVNFQLPEATGGETPYIYSATGLPRGLAFRNRRLQGIPDLPGTYTITYMVTDSNQDEVDQEFDWTITGNAIPQPTGLSVRIDWGNTFFSNPHADVTRRITSAMMFERGRGTASRILSRSRAGLFRFELQNSDGLFDEANDTSALAGLIRPGLLVQIRNGITPLWTGVLDDIPTRFKQNGQHRAEVTAYGIYINAAEPDVSAGSLTAESTAQAFIEMCAKSDLPYESPQPQPGDAYVMRRWWHSGKLRQGLNIMEDTEGGFIFEDREGELGFQLANYRATRTVQKTFVTGTPGTDQIKIVGFPQAKDAVKDVHNIIHGDVRQFEERANQRVFNSEDAIPIPLGGELDLVAVYDPNSGAVVSLDAISGWTANEQPDGSGTDRTSMVTISATVEDFNEVHIEILYPTMTGTQPDTLYVRGLSITGTVLTLGTPLRVPREDSVSKNLYRPKTLNLTGTWIRNQTDMQNRADAILAQIASPERRITIPWYIRDWNDFTALDLSDRVAIRMPTFSAEGFIEAIRVQIPLSGVNILCIMDISLVE